MSATNIAHALGDARTTGYWQPSPQTSQRVLGTFDTLHEPTRAYPERGA
jgi:hypothetical protein